MIIDNYLIESDGACITLYKQYTNKNGGLSRIIIGYYPNTTQACNRLLEEHLSDLALDSVTGVIEAIDNYKERVAEAVQQVSIK